MLVTEIIFTAKVIFAFMSLLFLVSLVIKRNDIADVAWGIGIFIVALVSYYTGSESNLSLAVTILTGLWGLRLAYRIYRRNMKKSEDARYKSWRDSWGRWFYVRSYLQIYILQGFLMLIIGYPFLHVGVYGTSNDFGLISVIGLIVWVIGYFFEVVGDYQLDKFLSKTENAGKIMKDGLWKYSRHPNYFGEVVIWWGIWIMISGLPMSYIALVSPLMVTFIILKVSGVPMAEKMFAGNEEFEEYKKNTSVFFPLPPKAG